MKHFLLSLLFLLPLCAQAQEGPFVVDHLMATIAAFDTHFMDFKYKGMICDDLVYRPVGENEVEVAVNYVPEEKVHEFVDNFFYYQNVLQFGLGAFYQYYWDFKSELESLDESQEDYEEAREKIEAQLQEFEPYVDQISDWQHRYAEELDMVAQDLAYRSPVGRELFFDFIIHLLKMSDVYREELAQIYDGMPDFPELSDFKEKLDNVPFSFFIDDLAHEYLEIEQQITEIIIPETICDGEYVVTSIGDRAFDDCYNLTSVTIPSSVTSIGYAAFYYCYNLTSVNIPASVTSIGDGAFDGCTALPVENGLRYADSYLVGAEDKTLSACSIKEGTRFIGDHAFTHCLNLTSVTIPESVTSIGYEAFEYCSGLTSVTIPASVVSIGRWAFSGCSGLTDVCSLNPTPQQIASYAFDGIYTTCTLHVPAGAKEAYAAAGEWKKFTNIVEDAEVYAVKSELQGKINNLAAEKEALEQKVADLEALVEALQNKMAGDVDGDGQITAGDITKVIQNALQLTK